MPSMNRLFPGLILILLTVSLTGQTSQNGTAVSPGTDPGIRSLYSLYYKYVSAPNELINGKEYVPYSFYSKTSPLLFSGTIFRTTLKVKGREYHDVRLQYDTFLDELVYTDTSRIIDDTYRRIALNKDIVDGFDFVYHGDSMRFRNMKFGDAGMKDGFYEIAYGGKTEFIIRHESSQYTYDALSEYKYSPARFIRAGGKYILIKDNKTFLKAFGPLSGEVKKYLKESRIRIKRADINQIVSVLSHFDALQKSTAVIQ
jgi:hypothetical protein